MLLKKIPFNIKRRELIECNLKITRGLMLLDPDPFLTQINILECDSNSIDSSAFCDPNDPWVLSISGVDYCTMF